jgi:iron complex transport system substrate-binding protein
MNREREENKHRIISLAPSVTSILMAIGARRQIAGVSQWCKDVADVGGLPVVSGDCWHFAGSGERKSASGNAATLMDLRPTMIIGSVPFKTEAVEKILSLPVPFLALNPRTLADIEADIRLLGSLSGKNETAAKLIRRMRGKFRAVAAVAKKANSKPLVYCEAWPHPRISSPPWVEELVEICGGKMAVRAGERVSDEEVARANPEVMVLAWAATGGKSKPEQALQNQAWEDVSAVRNKKVFVIRDELLNTPGPPLLQGAEELLRVIHPELAGTGPKRRGATKSAAS